MKSQVLFVTTLFGSLVLSLASAQSQADSWKMINDPDEVRQIIVDKALDAKYWKYYFRSDGKMAYEQGGFTSFREWKINTNGAICMNIYSMPSKSLGCQILSRADGTPAQYRIEHKNGKSKVQIVEPDQTLIDAVLKKAGSVD